MPETFTPAFAERLEPWSDLAIMASGASVFQHPTFLRGCDNLLAAAEGDLCCQPRGARQQFVAAVAIDIDIRWAPEVALAILEICEFEISDWS